MLFLWLSVAAAHLVSVTISSILFGVFCLQARMQAWRCGDISTLILRSHPHPISTRGVDYALPILVSTTSFESHRRAWLVSPQPQDFPSCSEKNQVMWVSFSGRRSQQHISFLVRSRPSRLKPRTLHCTALHSYVCVGSPVQYRGCVMCSMWCGVRSLDIGETA